ncbi:hypothetical protein DPEC_G00298390 [Dallia pectoralis]|uniref:Uncharacterized protein n=1 Tax=Dallia pectoralis TaxID=75939 RepID=A0ACC2FFV0_DALPE|nr:hypothetical protein DPEC_G00298390 [Dallia pectoralis]
MCHGELLGKKPVHWKASARSGLCGILNALAISARLPFPTGLLDDGVFERGQAGARTLGPSIVPWHGSLSSECITFPATVARQQEAPCSIGRRPGEIWAQCGCLAALAVHRLLTGASRRSFVGPCCVASRPCSNL